MPHSTETFYNFNDYFTSGLMAEPNAIYLQYFENPSDEKPMSLTYGQVHAISTNLAYKLDQEYGIKGKPVAFLGNHGVHFGLYLLALLKLDCRTLLISPRNSESAMVHLLETTETKVLLHMERFSQISTTVCNQIDNTRAHCVPVFDAQSKILLKTPIKEFGPSNSNDRADLKKTAIICHSSGTTGHPKPIQLNHNFLISFAQLCAEIFKSISNMQLLSLAPLFHVMGLMFICPPSAKGTYIFTCDFPPLGNTIEETIRRTNANCSVTPPLLLEQLANRIERGEADMSLLKRLKLSTYGGAALQRTVGKYLLDQGLNPKPVYGATEYGAVGWGDTDPNWKDFDYMKIWIPTDWYHLEDWNNEEGVKQLIISSTCPNLAVGVSNRPDGSYATKDLFRQHPKRPDYWQLIGRADDTLIMSNGEKTNPIPIEAAIRNYHPVIQNCAVVAHDRPATAALIQLNVKVAMTIAIEDILKIVEAAVDNANSNAPSHSRLVYPDMVTVLPMKDELPASDKGTILRKKVETNYQQLIDNLYDRFLNSEDAEAEPGNGSKLDLDPDTVSKFLNSTLSELLRKKPSEIDAKENVFDQGMDSLLAIQLRNSIVKRVKKVPNNFVFQYSTVETMTRALCSDAAAQDVKDSYEETKVLLKKYLRRIDEDMPKPAQSYHKNIKNPVGEIVVTTGATGSLGAMILRDLLKNPSVKKVYALVRGTNGLTRLTKTFKDRNLDTQLLSSGKLNVLPLDQAKPKLGLTDEQYSQVQSEATMICHCAWLVDFLQPVSYYEKECIVGLMNFINLAYRKGQDAMRLHFISSVSASMAMKGNVEEKPLPEDPSCGAPMGYAQSKFIAEHMLKYLADNKNMPTYVLRVGQMSGDTVEGYWNLTEQYPLMVVGGALHMKKMPTMASEIDWIPHDTSATSICEIMFKTANDQPSATESIFHIVNPNRVSWSTFLQSLRDNGLQFEEVSPEEWVSSLSKDEKNPAYKLISFYQDMFTSLAMPIWLTERTASVSQTLKMAPKLNSNLVAKYLKYWRSALSVSQQ
ncbi:hypothetical protein NQZ79_g6909 [Umbelopsis isabellina]|nr:hypothetical protein NQZ79_g6909 [Umbelopsis isabellina]